MTVLLNDNPHDPMFQVHVNLWHSTLQDSYKASSATAPAPKLEEAISNADAAVKAFKKRFKAKAQPEPVPAPAPSEYATLDASGAH